MWTLFVFDDNHLQKEKEKKKGLESIDPPKLLFTHCRPPFYIQPIRRAVNVKDIHRVYLFSYRIVTQFTFV